MTTTNGAAPAALAAGDEHQPPALKGFALFSVLAALMLTLFLQALDQTIVSTALPRIVSFPWHWRSTRDLSRRTYRRRRRAV